MFEIGDLVICLVDEWYANHQPLNRPHPMHGEIFSIRGYLYDDKHSLGVYLEEILNPICESAGIEYNYNKNYFRKIGDINIKRIAESVKKTKKAIIPF